MSGFYELKVWDSVENRHAETIGTHLTEDEFNYIMKNAQLPKSLHYLTIGFCNNECFIYELVKINGSKGYIIELYDIQLTKITKSKNINFFFSP
jgi:hypothetical protein